MSAITITDLENAKLDVDHIAQVSTSLALTATDRLGHVKDTVAGAVYKISGFTSRGAWAGPGTVYAVKDLVSNAGTWYVAVVAHTSAALFATDAANWRIYQGVTSGDLAASSGASLVGFAAAGTGAATRDLEKKVQEIVSIKDFENSPGVPVAGDGITPDTVGAQAFLDAGADEGYVPQGTYLCVGLEMAAPMRIHGPGKFLAEDDTDNVLTVSADNSEIADLKFQGTGNFTDDDSILSEDRICLIKVTGDNVTVRNATLTDAHQVFIHFYQCAGGSALDNHFFGGIPTMVQNSYQGIRGDSVSTLTALGNRFHDDGVGKCEQCIFVAPGDSGVVPDNVIASFNIADAAHAHFLYIGGAKAATIHENVSVTGQAGIVYTSADGWDGANWIDYAGGSVIGNVMLYDGVGTGSAGLYLRDVSNTVAALNLIKDFPISIIMQPVLFADTNHRMNNSAVMLNICSGFSEGGILIGLGGGTLGQMINNAASGNELTGTEASVDEYGLSWSVGTVLAQHNSACKNKIMDVGGKGISSQGQEYFTCEDNELRNVGCHSTGQPAVYMSNMDQLSLDRTKVYLCGKDAFELITCTNYSLKAFRVVDAGQTADATYYGVKLNNSDQGDVLDGWIEAQAATTNKIAAGIMGNNNSTGVRSERNTVLRSTLGLANRQMQQYTNSLRGNRTSFDPLVGTVTLDAAAETVIPNANVHTGLGVETAILLTPANAAAATLQGSVKCLYPSARVHATSITIKTANAAAAAGTETFIYELVQ